MIELAARCATRPLILDGGLATELSRRGYDLSDPLWSGRVLLDDPAAIEAVHYDYFTAGAEVAITASYQVTYEGMAARGCDAECTTTALRRSVALAQAARRRIEREHGIAPGALLVAASVGPYGAMRHDGSEYRGNYGRTIDELMQFHRRRIAVLVESSPPPDLLACETIPALDEARAIARVVREHPGATAWVAFTARDAAHTGQGDPLVECAKFLDGEPQIVAIGVNCVAPDLVTSLVGEIRRGSEKPIVVYPNAFNRWDPTLARAWVSAGAGAIGGCCGTTPDDIRAVAAAIA
jgi:homocysteine S-methyltransferase